MENEQDYAVIEKNLMDRLTSSNLSKEHLSRISKSIASSQESGLKLIDWWIYGIPAFENFVVEGQLPIEKGEILGKLIQKGNFDGLRIFRKGIPKPDFFQVQITTNHYQNR